MKTWVKRECLKQRKNKLCRNFIKTRNQRELSAFKKLINHVTYILRQTKNQYFHKLFPADCVNRSNQISQNLNIPLKASPLDHNILEITRDGTALRRKHLAEAFNN